MPKLDGSAFGDNSAHDQLGRFTTGNSEWHRKQQRIEAKTTQLALEYDATGAAARMLLKLAAQHLDAAEQARNSALRARHTRLGLKVLASLQRKPAAPLRSLDDYREAKERVTHD